MTGIRDREALAAGVPGCSAFARNTAGAGEFTWRLAERVGAAGKVFAVDTQPAMLDRIKKKMGRPKIGKGCKVVAVSVEVNLLKKADAYAKRLGLGRTELFTQALRGFLPAQNAS